MKKILVIGSLNMDMTVNVDHTPIAGETILCDSMILNPGGKGANQAYAAGKLGGRTAMLGAVGKDSYGAMQLEGLRNADVDVSGIAVIEGYSTGLAFITVNSEGDNCITVVSGANATLTPASIDAAMDLLVDSDIVVLQLETPPETVVYAVKKAKELGKLVILDPAPARDDLPEELYQQLDIIKPNETELAILTGAKEKLSTTKAAALLRQKGVSTVIVTLGGNGIYMDSATAGQVTIPARLVDAIDTTAAGDTFTAALAVRLSEGADLVSAVEFANAASSIAVTRKGAQASVPDREEVLAALTAEE